MTAHIDWLTIVGRREVDGADWSTNQAYISAADTLTDRCSSFIEAVGNPLTWQIVKPRAPYSYARRTPDCTRTLYVHPLAAHFTLEISGTHCTRMEHNHMYDLLRDFGGAFSRLDLAVDMLTPTTPLEFDAYVTAPCVQTHAIMQSSTGQTVYIGSRSSERFARVYRYNPPHPRAHLLRAEFQLKGGYANALAREATAGVTLASLAAGLGQHFGFTHECWKPGETAQMVRVQSHAQSGDTVAWLTKTVAPLLRRLNREGKLDTAEWFKEYVLKDIELYD